MIAQLSGELAYKSVDHVIVDVGGVGYRVMVPLSTYYVLPDAGAVKLHVYTHVKEDAIHLFGFLSEEEKQMFILLLSVSGVGPKLAANILSNIPADQLQTALGDADSKRLAAVPGIGKKTADRLVLELGDKVAKMLDAAPAGPGQATPATASTPLEDALSALVNLGYKENQARKALKSMEIPADASLEEVLKGALKILVK
ncbi:MAG: Holliday junction branch migration protein RuvA [Desulfuromonadales bacterium]|nr:Holliday junction branch migration protein RuvA [Desulfuromonadales bacterium]NIR34413.1 Holliday junction branch migration protein RuvA [Desulfuromonadales bacterium]NIS44421.1 Holliday junction branch migration protein RuvA [Desulfuromonadales bacterium]